MFYIFSSKFLIFCYPWMKHAGALLEYQTSRFSDARHSTRPARLTAMTLNVEGCGCQYSRYGCCPDKTVAARGPNKEGCGCQYTPHGCCPNKYTPAAGPEFEGCPCHTYQFGCCPDGEMVAKGPQGQGNAFCGTWIEFLIIYLLSSKDWSKIFRTELFYIVLSLLLLTFLIIFNLVY